MASDLHAFDKAAISGDEPSFIDVSKSAGTATQDLFVGLKELISSEGLASELLLCPGDLAHHAHPTASKFAWKGIHEIGSALGAKVIGTAGNHDVDSRHKHNDFDAKGHLQRLSPRFPIDDDALSDRFWARHFFLMEQPDYRLLVLNSSAYHGTTGVEDNPEYVHGRVADSTIDAICEQLGKSNHSLNILLCHHHPVPHEELGLGSHDLMKGGAELIRQLGSGDFGEWLVIHGHKHFPKLSYAPGSSTSAVIFAAGSLAAALYPQISGVARNQFYILEFDKDDVESLGLAGRYRAWDWISGKGWEKAQDRSGLPHLGGFGMRKRPSNLAKEIRGNARALLGLTWRVRFPSSSTFCPTMSEFWCGN